MRTYSQHAHLYHVLCVLLTKSICSVRRKGRAAAWTSSCEHSLGMHIAMWVE